MAGGGKGSGSDLSMLMVTDPGPTEGPVEEGEGGE